ncbi:hypothetical protein PM082_024197 [Marasmius tenuissimus]|nr:hypothetical protein PM082_024197 [Marasmius tenuissimus]
MECPSYHQDDCLSLISKPLVLFGVGLFLYGIYTVLYILCMYILFKRKRECYHIHVVSITTLYVAATIAVGLKGASYVKQAQFDIYHYTLRLPIFSHQFGGLTDGQREYERHLLANLAAMHQSAFSFDPCKSGVQAITILANCLTDILLC